MNNLFQRIKEIMKSVEYLQKDDNVDNRYKAISEEKVTTTIRKAMIDNGVVIIPVEQDYQVKENGLSKSGATNLLTTTNTKYRIQNVDDKEDYVIAASSGSGVDTQDKGIGKAMTYSYKYLLLRTFAIPTGEDPDKISSEEIDKKLQPKEPLKVGKKVEELPKETKQLSELEVWRNLGNKYSNALVKRVWTENSLGQEFTFEALKKCEELCNAEFAKNTINTKSFGVKNE